MKKKLEKTGERILPDCVNSYEDNILFLRHLYAYEYAKNKIPLNSFVLDLGCGEGYGTKFLSKFSKNVVGLDIDTKVISNAINKYKSENCNFIKYNGRKLPFHDNVFDAVISFQVIEHIKNDKNFLYEIHRVLKCGSELFITTPNRSYRLNPVQRPWNRYHIREYSDITFDKLLRSTFPYVQIFGIAGTDSIQKIEIERVKTIRRIDSLDPFHIRRIIPERFNPKIIEILKKITKKKNQLG